jgi:PKD repeat protein
MRFIRSIDIGKKILVLVTLCFMLTLVQAGSASTVTVQDAGVTSIGGTANVEIRLDSAPAGLSGYNITFSLSNPGIAEITQVTFPSWAGVTQTSTFPSDQVWLKALDLMNTAGSSNILLATLTIRGDAAGTTNVVPTVNQLDDDTGGIILSATDPGVFTVTVPQQNRAPELTAIGNKNVNEGQLLQFTVTATDPDGDSLSYSTSALPSGAQFNPTTRVFTWTPGVTQSGSYPVTFTVSDGLLTDSEQITISVGNVNRAPELTAIGNKNVNEGQLLQFTVTATDPDGDSLTYSTSALPSGAQFDPATKIFTWTPGVTQSGSYPVTFTVSDGLLTDSEQITITVTDVQENLAPELSPIGNKNVNEGQLLQFTVTASDPDGDSLTYSTSALPSGAQFDPITRIFTWTPGVTQSGSYPVTFMVSDGSIEDSEIVTITVLDKGVLDAAFLMDITSGTAPLVVHFSDQSSGNVRFRVWSFGDGSFSFEKNPVHTYRETGTYTVRLRVWDGKIVDTEVKTDCITVTQPELQADFTADTTSGTAPLKVRFMDASTGNVRYRTWYFGDGDTSHAQNAVHTYREAGTYTVRLVVSDGRGTDTEVKTDYITVTRPELLADFTADTTSGTAPLKVRFSDTSSGKVQFRVWSFGDGSSSFEKNPVHTYREAGIYTVRLTVYGKGDLDTETKTAYIRVSRPNSRNR